MAAHDLSIRRACAALRLSRAAYHRRPTGTGSRDELVIDALNDALTAHPRWGFWKCYDRLRLEALENSTSALST